MSWRKLVLLPATVMLLVVIIGVAFFIYSRSNLTQTMACITNLSNPPQLDLNQTLNDIARNMKFIEATQGLCYTFNSAYTVSGAGVGPGEIHFVFDHYSDRMVYPCGSYPVKEITKRLVVVPTYSGGKLVDVQIQAEDTSNVFYSCPRATILALGVVSVTLVQPQNAARPTVKITLRNDDQPITNLTTILELALNNYTIKFTSVTPVYPITHGEEVSQVYTLIGAAIDTDVIYKMVEVGTFQDGTAFAKLVYIQVSKPS